VAGDDQGDQAEHQRKRDLEGEAARGVGPDGQVQAGQCRRHERGVDAAHRVHRGPVTDPDRQELAVASGKAGEKEPDGQQAGRGDRDAGGEPDGPVPQIRDRVDVRIERHHLGLPPATFVVRTVAACLHAASPSRITFLTTRGRAILSVV
jgi:hypothetical protein